MPGVPDVSRFPARVWTRLHNKYWRRLRPDLLTYAPGGGRAAARGAGRLPAHVALGALHAGADRDHDRHPPVDRPRGAAADRPGRCNLDRGSVLLGRAQRAERVGADDAADPGRRRRDRAIGRRSRRAAEADAGHAVAPVSARDGDEPRAAADAARIRAPARLLDHRGRLRQRIPLRQPAARVAAGSRYGRAGDLCRQLRQDAVPGLRVGYLVAPEPLAESFATASAELYREGQLLQQAVLAEFIAEGHFVSHIRKMRTLYGQRREVLLDASRSATATRCTRSAAMRGCIWSRSCRKASTIARSRRPRLNAISSCGRCRGITRIETVRRRGCCSAMHACRRTRSRPRSRRLPRRSTSGRLVGWSRWLERRIRWRYRVAMPAAAIDTGGRRAFRTAKSTRVVQTLP